MKYNIQKQETLELQGFWGMFGHVAGIATRFALSFL